MRAEPLSAATYDHGEGVRWDADRGELLWVDITAGRFLRAPLDRVDDPVVVQVDRPVGAVTPVASGGWLLAAGRGLLHVADEVREVAELEPADVRMNDATCDPSGRFWAGSMAYDATEGAASLHRLDLDGTVRTVLRDLTISNGLGWSPDGSVLYLNDSGPSVTYAFDLVDGELGERRVLVHHEDGLGDGMAVDDEGCLWIPLWGGGCVDRYDPQGRRVQRIDVPARQPSDCCLVDGRLVITTARRDVHEPGPHDGRLLVADVGVSGPPVTPFLGVLPA